MSQDIGLVNHLMLKSEYYDKLCKEGVADLEDTVMKNLFDLLDNLYTCTLENKIFFPPQVTIGNMTAYLGMLIVEGFEGEAANQLMLEVQELIGAQIRSAYEMFCQYPLFDKKESEEENFQQLSKVATAHIISSTLHLFNATVEAMHLLSIDCTPYNGFFAPPGRFFSYCQESVKHSIKSDADTLIQVIKQTAKQIAWLSGFYSHMELLSHKKEGESIVAEEGEGVVASYMMPVISCLEGYRQACIKLKV